MAPVTSFAVIGTAPGVATLEQVTTPVIQADQILVKTHAVALNPTDWKHEAFLLPIGATLGCDFAGVVDSVGAAVTNVQVGDRVAGFVHGGREPGTGSFQEYVRTEGTQVWKVPAGTSFEKAAALGGIGPHTAYQALYLRHSLPKVGSAPTSPPTPFLVYGGSTSVGMYAIQLARLSGLTVVTTCSPRNFALVKSLGATDAFDYADPATPAAIRAKYPTLALGLDTIAEKGSTAILAKSLGAYGGKIVTLLPVQEADQGGVDGVEVESTLVYTVLGKAFVFPGWKSFPVSASDKAGIEAWLLEVPTIIGNGSFKANPLLKLSGGLANIREGLDLLKAGKASGQKVSYVI